MKNAIQELEDEKEREEYEKEVQVYIKVAHDKGWTFKKFVDYCKTKIKEKEGMSEEYWIDCFEAFGYSLKHLKTETIDEFIEDHFD